MGHCLVTELVVYTKLAFFFSDRILNYLFIIKILGNIIFAFGINGEKLILFLILKWVTVVFQSKKNPGSISASTKTFFSSELLQHRYYKYS